MFKFLYAKIDVPDINIAEIWNRASQDTCAMDGLVTSHIHSSNAPRATTANIEIQTPANWHPSLIGYAQKVDHPLRTRLGLPPIGHAEGIDALAQVVCFLNFKFTTAVQAAGVGGYLNEYIGRTALLPEKQLDWISRHGM
ncbi:hypothetical protein AURDEDRAFT_163415 [Auricularia subglabra TFB-10046 SS5]|nr:hypothetical protein AURDEDRAFT_163415 [Auricularia subglabra TFB-10046 SS5]